MQLSHHCRQTSCSHKPAACLHLRAHVQRNPHHASSGTRILQQQQQQQQHQRHLIVASVQQQQHDRSLQSAAPDSSSHTVDKQAAGDAAAAASPTAAAGPASSGRWQLLSRSNLAGGTLEVVAWEGERCLRIWLPPGYSSVDAHRAPYPAVYLNDGQNLFGDCATLSGASWGAAGAAAQLIAAGKLPPFVVVGIDHAGPLRSLEYTPCTPGSGPRGFRSDASDWPGGGIGAYLGRVRDEVLPWVSAHYPVSTDPQDRVFGGSSFGGIAALAAGMCGAEGCGFGALLVESPSLWIGDPEPEAFLQEVLAYKGSWPSRVYLGMGGREYSGTRGGQRAEHDANFPRYLKSLYASLTLSGLGPSRLAWAFEPEHAHTESAWAARLPAALQFLGGGWWQRWLQRYDNELFFTIPRRLKAGMPGQLLFFNRRNSHTLAGARGGLKMIVGSNGWQHTQHLQMKLAGEVQRPELKEPQQLREQVLDGWRAEYRGTQEEQLRQQEQEFQHRMATERDRLAAARAATAAAAAAAAAAGSAGGGESGVGGVAQQEQQLREWQQHLDDQERQWWARPPLAPAVSPQIQSVLYQQPASCSIGEGSSDWLLVQLPPLPADAYEINFVFCDAAGTAYDNNDSNDFWLPVRQPEQLLPWTPGGGGGGSSDGGLSRPARSSGTVAAVAATFAGDACGWLAPGRGLEAYAEALDAATAAAERPAEEAVAAAAASCQYFFFSLPPVPVAGAAASLFVNKSRLCSGLHEATA
ncbi:Alpha/Beta hydrolase protein [Scenedesmus sp. NREL 46B-D3]|nr:Alpha/Beta hydrolase protein [Scenedesmus sp. NREL 46B-D3]